MEFIRIKKGLLFPLSIISVSLILLVLVGMCRRQEQLKPGDPESKGHNLILITVDTLRVDYLGIYGYPNVISPNLDRLAHQSLVFQQAYATAPFTGPSHASILTSQHPSTHGVIFNGHVVPAGISKNSVTLAEHLKKNGFTTAAVVSSPTVGKKYGFGRGFDFFRRINKTKGYRDKGGPGKRVTKAAGKWLAAAAEKWSASGGKDRFFLWVHYFDPHLPYTCDDSIYKELKIPRYEASNKRVGKIYKKNREHVYQAYRADVFEADKHIGDLLQRLKTLGLEDRTVVAVAADHGEYLGEKRQFSHSLLYKPVLHVPMFIHVPQMDIGTRRKDVVSTIDLAPTLLALLSLPEMPAAQGRNLLNNFSENTPVFAEWRDYNLVTRKKKINPQYFLISVQVGNIKLIRSVINPKRNLLFNLDLDPDEEKNLVFKDRKLYKRMETILENHIKKDLPNGLLGGDYIKLDGESIKMLKSLGYIK